MFSSHRFAVAVAVFALVLGTTLGCIHYRAGLTLSHPDAKAHLVVARRVLDSMTPGWLQIGAVWLPLPHVLNLVPVQIDALYRTGLFAVALSIAGFALAVYGACRLVLEATGSRSAAAAGSAVLLLNPNVLYLQATPMTEPMYLGFTLLGLALLYSWLAGDADDVPHAAGISFAAACLTRYEAWAVTGAALTCAAFTVWRHHRRPVPALVAAIRVAVYPVLAIALFLVLSRATTGSWFASPLFMRANPAKGDPFFAAYQVWTGLQTVSGTAVLAIGAAGVLGIAAAVYRRRERAAWLLVLAAFAMSVLPWHAYMEGHPVRTRYMVQAIGGVAAAVGIAVSLVRQWRRVAAVAVIALTAVTTPPFDFSAPMIHEAQWDAPKSAKRQAVTEYLARHRDGEPILISMTALAHYMQETSAAGFGVRDFVHEGNGQRWADAVAAPSREVGWVIVKSDDVQCRDRLLAIMKEQSTFLDGFDHILTSGGVTLYRRAPRRTAGE